MEAAPRVLFLLGARALESEYQLQEVVRGAEFGHYASARSNDTPFEKMPAVIRDRKVHNLDVTKEDLVRLPGGSKSGLTIWPKAFSVSVLCLSESSCSFVSG